jgi:tagaturonate reductase
MVDEKIRNFLNDTLQKEIIPFVSNDTKSTTEFANSVMDRFFNPYLNHQLTSISLNSISKWKSRNLPSFKDYYNKYGKIAENLCYGFACLMKIYSGINKIDDKFVYNLPNRQIQIQDDLTILEYFANGGSVKEFMQNVSVWGEDLTAYNGFYEKIQQVIENL